MRQRSQSEGAGFPLILAGIVAAFLFLATSAGAGENVQDRQALREVLREILKEEPSLVLDVLRANSEFVLDVAQQGSDLRRQRILLSQWEQDRKHPKSVRLENRPTLGSAGAPVTITAFTDFTCVYCREGEQTIKRLLLLYDGKIRVVYKNMPMKTHPGAVEAAEFMLAAQLQDIDKSWELFDTFFANRTKILSGEGQAFMRSAAENSGLNLKRLLADAKSAKVQKILAEDEEDARKLQFEGTPSFLVNNLVIRGALQENLFRQAVDMALDDASGK
ncbi:MAG: thioredoxin domain-containing protein [Deltaproteobacteria bacterium]|jgi:protein-disulfide isomerase|nr:thioredoxin domain-containing protein [Deltaproteobacteria bacterium]